MNWQNLSQQMKRRRVELGISKRQAIAKAEISSNTWLKIENKSEPISDGSWSGIEHAMQWEAGSVAAVLDGGEAIPMPPPASTAEQIDELFRRVERLESRLRELE